MHAAHRRFRANRCESARGRSIVSICLLPLITRHNTVETNQPNPCLSSQAYDCPSGPTSWSGLWPYIRLSCVMLAKVLRPSCCLSKATAHHEHSHIATQQVLTRLFHPPQDARYALCDAGAADVARVMTSLRGAGAPFTTPAECKALSAADMAGFHEACVMISCRTWRPSCASFELCRCRWPCKLCGHHCARIISCTSSRMMRPALTVKFGVQPGSIAVSLDGEAPNRHREQSLACAGACGASARAAHPRSGH